MSDEKAPKLTPLELLKKRQSPIFDVVHGTDNPGRKPPKKQESAVEKNPLDGRSLVKDLIPAGVLHSLQTLHWRLERAEARKKKRAS